MSEGPSQEEIIRIRLQAIVDMQAAMKELQQLGKSLEQIQKSRGASPELAQTVQRYQSAARAASNMATEVNRTGNAVPHVQRLNNVVKNLRNEINQTAQSQKQIGINLSGSIGAQNKQWKSYTDGLKKYQYAFTGTPKNVAMAVRNVVNLNRGLKDVSVAGRASADSMSAMNRGKPAFMSALSSTEKLKVSLAGVSTQAKSLSYSLRKTAQDNQWAARQLTMGITLPLVGIATESVRSFARVSGEMVQLKKVTDFKEDYDAFTKSIRAMSAEFGSSRFAVTSLFRDIAQLGVEGQDNIEQYAQKVERLALVGQMSTETAMTFFRTTKALFAEDPKLNLKDEQEQLKYTEELLADFNTVADRTTLKLEDLAEAFPEVAPVMQQMGFSAVGVAASLAAMHKSGIPATEAAHALKFGMQRIVDPTKKADQYLSEMGFSLFDLKGNVTAADYQIMSFAQSMSKLSAEEKLTQIGEIFGKRQAARLSIFVNDVEKGRQELLLYNKGLLKATDIQSAFAKSLVSVDIEDNMGRYTKALEEIKKDPSTGLKRLRAAIDDIKVQIGAALAPALIDLGQKLTDLVNKFLNMSPSMQKFIIAVLALAAALGPIRYFVSSLTAIGAAAIRTVAMFIPVRYVSEAAAQALIAQGKSVAQVGGVYVHLGGVLQRIKTNYLGVTSTATETTSATINLARAQAENAAIAEMLANAQNQVSAATNRAAAAETLAATATGTATKAELKQSFHRGFTITQMDQLALANARATGSSIFYSAAMNAFVRVNENGSWSTMSLTAALQGMNQEQAQAIVELIAMGVSAPTEKFLTFNAALVQNTEAQILNQAAARGEITDLVTLTATTDRLTASLEANTIASGRNAAARGADVGTAAAAPATGMAGMLGRFSAALSPSKMAASFKALIPVVLVLSAKILAIAAVIAVVVASVYAFTKIFRDNWGAFVNAMQPGIQAIKKAFETVKTAFSNVVSMFSSIIGQLGSGSSELESAGSAVEGIGGVISRVFEIIAVAIEGIASLINFVKPFFESLAYKIKDAVGVISALFEGDWKKAWMYFLAAMYEVLRPALTIVDIIVKAVAQGLASILNLASKIPLIGGSLKGVAKQVESFSDLGLVGVLDQQLREGLTGAFREASGDPAKSAAENAGKALGTDLANEASNAASDAGGGAGTSWVESWVSAVYAELENGISKIRDSATKALEKAHEAILKTYDDRIKAIEDQEKAEEKLLRTEEYLSKRRELLRKREIDKENYRKERLRAIYEGRINDVRIMDLEQQIADEESANNIADLDANRARDLLREQRDLAREQINIEKDAANERLQIQSDALKAYLDEIFKYKPATVEEFQSMMDQVNQVLSGMGVSWPEYGANAMTIFQEALQDANEKIVKDFETSGKSAMTAWMEAFITPEAKAILTSAMGGGGGGGGTAGGGAAAGTAGAAPEVGPELSAIQDKYSKANALAASEQDQIIIDLLKQQIALGDDRSSQHELYAIAYRQFIIDRSKGEAKFLTDEQSRQALIDSGFKQYKAGQAIVDEYSDRIIEIIHKNTEVWMQDNTKVHQSYRDMYDAITSGSEFAADKQILDIRKTSDNVTIYTDKIGDVWKEVGGKLENQWGQTAEFIRDKNGNITNSFITATGEIRTYTKSTFDDATLLLQDMIDKGIKPGSQAAQVYIQKINDLGYAVMTLPNGKAIVISADAARAFDTIRRLAEGLNKIGSNISLGDIDVLSSGVDPHLLDPNAFSVYGKWFRWTNRELGEYEEFAKGGLVKAQKNGLLAKIAEGGYDEFVISTDPKYRAANMGYIAAAASKLGMNNAAKSAKSAIYSGSSISGMMTSGSAEYSSREQNTYITVDTFIGEEKWFEEMAKKYNMKAIPRERKIAGQQKRVISSYNNRWDVK